MRRHATAQRLLEIAIEDIDAHGEAALRVEAVVERAGVAITAVYHHFGNREGLVEAAQAERFTRAVWPLILSLGGTLDEVDNPVDLERALLEILTAATDASFTENRLRRASAVGATLGRPGLASAIAAEQRRVNAHIAGLLRPFQERGMLRADLDLEAFGAWITGLILSRVVIEFDPSSRAGGAWDDLTHRAAQFLLFGPGGASAMVPERPPASADLEG